MIETLGIGLFITGLVGISLGWYLSSHCECADDEEYERDAWTNEGDADDK